MVCVGIPVQPKGLVYYEIIGGDTGKTHWVDSHEAWILGAILLKSGL